MEDLSPKITKRQALTECVELWNWLAENGRRCKSQWFEEHDKNYVCFCPCCHWVFKAEDDGHLSFRKCENCPIDWPEGWVSERAGACTGSIYGRWEDCVVLGDRERLALQIMELAQEALARLGSNKS